MASVLSQASCSLPGTSPVHTHRNPQRPVEGATSLARPFARKTPARIQPLSALIFRSLAQSLACPSAPTAASPGAQWRRVLRCLQNMAPGSQCWPSLPSLDPDRNPLKPWRCLDPGFWLGSTFVQEGESDEISNEQLPKSKATQTPSSFPSLGHRPG